MEVFWPNEVAESNMKYRESSKNLAQLLQKEVLEAIRAAGYEIEDRGVKEDPDKRTPLANSETTTGPYIILLWDRRNWKGFYKDSLP